MYSFSFYFCSKFYKYKKLFNEAMENKDDTHEELCKNNIKANAGVDKIHNEDHFNKVCPAALYYLDDLSKSSYYNMDEGCKYLYYGIYNNILKNENYAYDKLDFYKILLKGYYDINDWDSYENYIKEINEDILERNNNLMKIYDNFESYKDSLGQQKEKRCVYINNCIEIYLKYTEKCKTNNDLFCAELNQFIERYNKHMENDFPCDNLQNFLPYLGKSNMKVIILIPIILITLKLFILYILYKVSTN
ncbi:hypothetical protein PVNG_02153 [Plasmodium vivax North Korean]|uniref:Variable surface protein n=1 Tax=Plasmodium vivax North Korean TaxID=1035514 RepID=A0A0J9TTK2_PLAVI|nr:hypothetical protein PVNG_02153 [Plasmodium vivax North Korean]